MECERQKAKWASSILAAVGEGRWLRESQRAVPFQLESKKVGSLAMQASFPEAAREVVWARAFRESKNV